MISEQNYFYPFKIIFMGTSLSSIIPFNKLLNMHHNKKIQLLAVVTQPAKPAGRNLQITDPPLAQEAKSQGIITFQPPKASAEDFIKTLHELNPDIIITAAYGQILSEEFLKIPKRGVINIHPSYLPQYRGATPVQSALLDGCTKTGVSIIFTIKALDAGPIIIQKEVSIDPHENAKELEQRLFSIGADLLEETFNKLQDPLFKGTLQDPQKVSYCYKIKKEDGFINFQIQNSQMIYNKYRAFWGWPKVFCFFNDKRINLEKIHIVKSDSFKLSPSEACFIKDLKKIIVGCSDSLNTHEYIAIEKLMPEGKKLIDACDFWNGLKNPKNIFFNVQK